MNPIFKAAVRAATLQAYCSGEFQHSATFNQQNVRQAFVSAFSIGEHLYDKLMNHYDGNVPKWLRSLDEGNERIFFESDHFNFLN